MAANMQYVVSPQKGPDELKPIDVPAAPDYSSLFNSYMAQQQAAMEAARQARIDAANRGYAAVDSALQQSYQQGQSQLNSASDKSLQEAYVNRMLGERNLQQQLAASGRSGGAAETTLLGLQNSYGTARADIEQNRQDNLQQLYTEWMNQKAQNEQTRQNAIAGAATDYAQALAQARSAMLDRQADLLARQVQAGSAAAQQANFINAYADSYNDALAKGQDAGQASKAAMKAYAWQLYENDLIDKDTYAAMTYGS